MPDSRQNATPRTSRRIDLAYVELASSELARDINRDIVLEIIRGHQPISRAELSRSSGLQPSTVSNIVEQLIEEKWIVEGAAARRPRGRRPTLLELNNQLCILVADVRPGHAILAVVDLNGRLLAHEDHRLAAGPQRSFEIIAAAMLKLRDRFPNHTFEGVGVSVPGRVHPVTQQLILAPNLKWSNFDLRTALAEALGLQIEIDNDATACLLSELWFGRMDGVRNAVLVSLSEGLGTAILANGHIVSGLNGLAGEFGHIAIDPQGPLCGCGQRGCWETFASSSAALRLYNESAPPSSDQAPIHDIQVLLRRVDEGDARAISAVEAQAQALGRGLRLITAALSPELILVTGALTTCWSHFGPIVERELEVGILAGHAPRLGITQDGELARLRGAAAIVLQRHTGYLRSTHVHRSASNRKTAEAPTPA